MNKTAIVFTCMAMMLSMQTAAERSTEIFVAPEQKELLEPLYPPSAVQ